MAESAPAAAAVAVRTSPPRIDPPVAVLIPQLVVIPDPSEPSITEPAVVQQPKVSITTSYIYAYRHTYI